MLEPKVGLIQNEVNRLVRLIVTYVNQVEYNSMYKGVTLCGILQLPPRGLVTGKLWPYIQFQVGATQAHDNCKLHELRLVIQAKLLQSHRPFNRRNNLGEAICLLLQGRTMICGNSFILQRFGHRCHIHFVNPTGVA